MSAGTFEPRPRGLFVEADSVTVEPGAAAATAIHIHSSVDAPVEVMVDVVGPHASWCTVSPRNLRLAMHGRTQTTGHVHVPAQLASGPAPVVIGIRVRAVGADVPPHVGELRVVPLVTVDVGVDVAPGAQRVSGTARFVAVVRNNGHTPVRVRLHPGELGNGAQMRIRPPVVEVPPRGRARSKVAVRAPAPWTGAEPEHRLTVRATVGDRQIHAPASFVQRTHAGTALLVLAGLLLVLAIILAALLFRGDVTASTDATAAALLILRPTARRRTAMTVLSARALRTARCRLTAHISSSEVHMTVQRRIPSRHVAVPDDHDS